MVILLMARQQVWGRLLAFARMHPYRAAHSQEVLRQTGFETTFSAGRRRAQSGAPSAKPRVVRGFRRLLFDLNKFEVNVLAEQKSI